MAHNLDFTYGQASMLYVGETPWHSFGKKWATPPSIDEVKETDWLNWEVGTKPIYDEDGKNLKHLGKIVYRKDNGLELSVVGRNWTPYQNSSLVELMRPLVESGAMSIETVGVLEQGRRVWMLCKLDISEVEITPEDKICRYLMVSNRHGIGAVRFGFTDIRTVCANTLGAAHESKDSKLIRVFHSKEVKENVELIRDTINLTKQSFEATAEQFRKLVKKKINYSDLKKYIVTVLGHNADEQLSKKTQVTFEKIYDMVQHGKGNDLDSVKGTVWAAYNGVTEYLSYTAGRTAESRLNSLWFGVNKSVNQKALELAIAM